jgi:hypothetical protein
MIAGRFTVLAPFWALWLANAAITVAVFAVIAVAVFPKFPTAAAWPWNVVAVVAAGLIFGLLTTMDQRPMRRGYDAALVGLDRRQRTLAIKAVRGNDIPSDPAVLAAAVRVAALHTTYLSRLLKTQKPIRWWLPPLWMVIAALQFCTHKPRMGAFYLAFAVYFGAYFVLVAYQAKRLPPRVTQLRDAAAALPEAQAALADTADGALTPSRPKLIIWIIVAGMLACFALAEYFWGTPWGHQTPAQAVAVVRDLRTQGGPAAPTAVISAHETDYQATISAITDQLSATKSKC